MATSRSYSSPRDQDCFVAIAHGRDLDRSEAPVIRSSPEIVTRPQRAHQSCAAVLAGAHQKVADFMCDGAAEQQRRVHARLACERSDPVHIHRRERTFSLLWID